LAFATVYQKGQLDEALWQRGKERQLAVRRDIRPDTGQPAQFWEGRCARYLRS
jgi:hypothetical protein